MLCLCINLQIFQLLSVGSGYALWTHKRISGKVNLDTNTNLLITNQKTAILLHHLDLLIHVAWNSNKHILEPLLDFHSENNLLIFQTMSELKMILKALKADAEILLLFLRYVEKVEVFAIDVNESVSKVFGVETDQNTKATRRNSKERFLSDIESYCDALPPPLEYEVTIECDAEKSTKQECKWIVINWVGSTKQKVMEVSKKVHSLPWLGLAVPFTPQRSSRLFCFLPMPDSKEVNTPLPVCGELLICKMMMEHYGIMFCCWRCFHTVILIV